MKRERIRRATVAAFVVLGAIAAMPGAAGAADSYKPGQKAPSGDMIFKVHGWTDPYTSPNQFSQPDPGNRLVAVDVEVINKKDEQQSWSSLLGAHLYTKDRKTYDSGFVVTDPPAPDGEIPAKFSVRGLVAFEIPANSPVQYVLLQGNITANGALVKLKLPKGLALPPPG